MELDVLIMPNLAKMEFSVHPDYWKDELIRVKNFFSLKKYILLVQLYLQEKLLEWLR